jgi:hypothetical protein
MKGLWVTGKNHLLNYANRAFLWMKIRTAQHFLGESQLLHLNKICEIIYVIMWKIPFMAL